MKEIAGKQLVLFHVFLILLSVLFSLPFLWMVSTSFKADDEIIHDPMVWMPEMPNRVTSSPYLDFEAHPPRWARPVALPDNVDWKSLQSALRTAIRQKAVDIFKSPDWPAPIDRREPALFTRAAEDIEDSLWESVRQRVPEGVWQGQEMVEAVVDRIKPEDVRNAWQRSYRVLQIGAIFLRNSSAMDIGTSPKPENDRIHYQIENRSEPILLSDREIRLASPEEKIDQIMVRVKGDASYHKLAVELEAQDGVFRTEFTRFSLLGGIPGCLPQIQTSSGIRNRASASGSR